MKKYKEVMIVILETILTACVIIALYVVGKYEPIFGEFLSYPVVKISLGIGFGILIVLELIDIILNIMIVRYEDELVSLHREEL